MATSRFHDLFTGLSILLSCVGFLKMTDSSTIKAQKIISDLLDNLSDDEGLTRYDTIQAIQKCIKKAFDEAKTPADKKNLYQALCFYASTYPQTNRTPDTVHLKGNQIIENKIHFEKNRLLQQMLMEVIATYGIDAFVNKLYTAHNQPVELLLTTIEWVLLYGPTATAYTRYYAPINYVLESLNVVISFSLLIPTAFLIPFALLINDIILTTINALSSYLYDFLTENRFAEEVSRHYLALLEKDRDSVLNAYRILMLGKMKAKCDAKNLNYPGTLTSFGDGMSWDGLQALSLEAFDTYCQDIAHELKNTQTSDLFWYKKEIDRIETLGTLYEGQPANMTQYKKELFNLVLLDFMKKYQPVALHKKLYISFDVLYKSLQLPNSFLVKSMLIVTAPFIFSLWIATELIKCAVTAAVLLVVAADIITKAGLFFVFNSPLYAWDFACNTTLSGLNSLGDLLGSKKQSNTMQDKGSDNTNPSNKQGWGPGMFAKNPSQPSSNEIQSTSLTSVC